MDNGNNKQGKPNIDSNNAARELKLPSLSVPKTTPLTEQLSSVSKRTNVKPEGTAVKPEKTAVKPERTAIKPEKTAIKPEGTAIKPDDTTPQAKEQASSSKYLYQVGDVITIGSYNCTIVELLGSGTEGEIYKAREGRKTYALKVCHEDFKTNTKVLSALQTLKGKGYIVDIEDYSDTFELMEFVEGKSAAFTDFNFPADPKHEKKAQTILAIAVKVAMSLDKMHEAKVLHKDIKPANILIKDISTWNCVLCDFGIADILKTEMKNGIVRTFCVTKRSRTPIYAAPEIYKEDNAIINDDQSISSEMTPKSDFYSLGMTILSLWMGEEAMRNAEAENALRKIRGHITVPDDMPDPLNRITRGLLIKDPAKRWDYKSIEAFLNGEDVSVEEDEILADLNIVYNTLKHQIAHTLEDLSLFMDEDHELAARYLYKGQINKWLSDYPELQARLDDIVENRYKKDHEGGAIAAIFTISPEIGFILKGFDRTTGEEVNGVAYSLKDVTDFYSRALPHPYDNNLDGIAFFEWVRSRNAGLADAMPTSETDFETFMLRLQTIDPLTDINLCNDPNDPDYAMTQEGIARTLNKAYNIFYNTYNGDLDALLNDTSGMVNDPKYRKITLETVAHIAANVIEPQNEGLNYIADFMKTKGNRFSKQIDWLNHCLDYENEDNQEKAGPKDEVYLNQVAWMRIIKGYGIDPIYHLEDENADVTTIEELFKFPKKTLRKEYYERGLQGWLAVQHHENPNASLGEKFAYEKLLYDYLEDVRRIDGDDEAVQRFDEAVAEARHIYSEGKGKIGRQGKRNATQLILSILLGVLPCLALATVLVVSIIMHPSLDMSGFKLERFIWPVGLVIGAISYFVFDADGCVLPIISGAIGAVVLFFLVKFLGKYILYIYLAVVLAALIVFSIKTIFSKSSYATKARRFDKPDFEEFVLEPLYYAFSDEDEFDSSLNGMVDDDYIDNWRTDLNDRRKYVLLFIGATILLWVFSMFLPRGGKEMNNPFVQKIVSVFGWDKAPKEEEEAYEIIPMPEITKNLSKGSKGEAVTAMQKRLKQLGYYNAEISDVFDNDTRTAVIAFQKANKLSADGVVGAKTLKKMFDPETIPANVKTDAN